MKEFDFLPLLTVTLLAMMVPVVLHRLRLAVPIVVGEIVAGIIVGRSGFDLIRGDHPYLDFLSEFGFAYLMFLSGLEVDFDLLSRGARRETGEAKGTAGGPLPHALVSFALTVLVSLGFGWLLVDLGYARDALVMALILSTTSLGVVMPVLKERGVLRSDLGQHTLIVSVIGDFATVALISAYVIFRTAGPTFEVLLVLVLIAATVLIYRVAKTSRRHLPLERWVDELSHATGQLDTRAALALAVVFIALARGMGVEAILGAFMAGTIVSLLSREESSDLRLKLNALGYGFFIPIFFIMVGVELELPALVGSAEGVRLIPILLLMAFAVKFLAALVYRSRFGWREVLALGSITSARLSLIIAVAAIGVRIEAITETTEAAVVVVSVITVIASPLFFNLLVQPRPEPRSRIVIVGSLPHATLLAQRLQAGDTEVRVLTASRRFHREARARGIPVVRGVRGRYIEGLERAGIEGARALISMVRDEEESCDISVEAKRRYGVETVIARARRPEIAERLKAEGIQVLEPGLSLVAMLEAMVKHPHAFSILTHRDIGRHLDTVTVRNPDVDGRPLRETRLPGDALLLVIARDGEVIIPRGTTRLRLRDVVTLVGSRESVERAVDYLGAGLR